MSTPDDRMIAAKDTPYFTPAQNPAAGTALPGDWESVPKIFQPLRIRGVEFQNRIWLSPLCQFSADNGKLTEWHIAHLGGILTRGPGLTTIEGTAVSPEGRIGPQDSGLWSDEHIAPLARIVTFAHSQSQKIAIQLCHSGRKGSVTAAWIPGATITSKASGGWPDDLWAPSAISFSDSVPTPHALTKEGIDRIVQAFADAAKRAVEAGIDVIEIHAAHGYLISSFLSPTSNQRMDGYGGSFENRIRFLLEVVDAVRASIPETMPFFVRVSATEWLEEVLPNEPSWRSEDTARLAPILYEHGVDLIDISSGGNNSKQKIITGPAYQARFAQDVMRAIGATESYPSPSSNDAARPFRILVSAVGHIKTGTVAEKVLQDAQADVIFVGRPFIKNPGTVWQWVEELANTEVPIQVAAQMGWPFKGRMKRD